MSLILATGTNLGNREENLLLAKNLLSQNFKFIAESRIYTSPAVEYLNQPDFYNQVLEFEIPKFSPTDTMEKILLIEAQLGRKRDIPKGPRIIDIDIIFWKLDKISSDNISVPHPAWQDRSFVALPLQELPYFQTIKKSFIIPTKFNNTASPIS